MSGSNLAEREAQVLAVTAQDREELNDENPIIHAEMGPCRYQTITLWFPEEDGVRIEHDLDLNEYQAFYIKDDGTEEKLEEDSTMYEWIRDFYDKD